MHNPIVTGSMLRNAMRNALNHDTSAESYHAAVEEGIVSRNQYRIIQYMLDRSGRAVTQGEVNRYFSDTNRSYGTRFKELEDAGVIQCVGVVKDDVTNRTVKKYRLTGYIPAEKIKRKKKKGLGSVFVLCKRDGIPIRTSNIRTMLTLCSETSDQLLPFYSTQEKAEKVRQSFFSPDRIQIVEVEVE